MADIAVRDITAGAIGGGVGLLTSQPFDTVKSRIQAQIDAGHTDHGLTTEKTRIVYKNGMDCFKKTLKTEGIRGLYKGMAYPLGGQALINAIVFYVEGQCMRLLQPQGGTQSIPNSIVSGAVAGGVQSIVCSPMELIKLRMQVQGVGEARSARNHRYRGPWQTTKLIWQKDGFRKGIMKGFNMTIARECTSFGLYFSSYRFFCKAFASTCTEGSVDDLGLFWRSLSGGMTGCVVWIASYPFDVVKTKIQTDGISSKHVYHGSWDCFKKLYAKNGSKVFFKGLSPCLVRGFLNSFSLLPAADYVKKYWPW